MIDPDEDDYILTRELLSDVKVGTYELDRATSYESGLELVGKGGHQLCLVDYRLGERSGVDLIREACAAGLRTPMILLTGQRSPEVDLEAMQAGAMDYLVKDEAPTARLESAIRYAVELNAEREKSEYAFKSFANKHAAIAEIGRLALTSVELQDLFDEAVPLIARTLNIEHSSALELLPGSEFLRVRAAYGFNKECIPGVTQIPCDPNSQAGFTLRSGEPVIVDDLRNETRFRGSVLLRDHGVVSGVVVIIGALDRPYGVLGVHARSHRRFGDDDIHFLRSVANILGEAVNRKNVETALREQATLLESAQRIGRMGSWSVELSSGKLSWSRATCELFGITEAEFDGTSEQFLSFILEEDRPKFERAQANLSTTNPMLEIEYRIRRADGTIRSLYERGNVAFDKRGKPSMRLGMVMDVTEQREARDQLEQSAALLRIAGRAARLGAWSIRLPERDLIWSDENCAIHEVPNGYVPTLEEGLSYYAPEHRAEISRSILECETNGTPYDLELPKLTAKGRLIWVRSIGEAVRDVRGKIIGLQGAFQDITEKKNAEAALRERNALIRMAGKITQTGGWALTVPENKLFWSDEIFDILKLPRGPVPGLNEALAMHPAEWQEEITNALTDCAEKGIPFDREVEIFDANQNKIWVRVCGEAERDAIGNIIRIQGALQNITERRLEQDSLRQSENRLRIIFDNSAVGIALVSVDGRPTQRNLALQKMLGYSSEELSRMTFREFTHPEDLEEDQRLFRELCDQKCDSYQVEKRYIRKDGEIIWVNLTISAVRNDDGTMEYAVSIVENITKRKIAEERLGKSAEYLALANEVAKIGSFDFDLKTQHGSGTPLLPSIFGEDSKLSESGYDEWLRRVHPDDIATVSSFLEKAIATGVLDSEYRIINDGDIRWLWAKGRVIYDSQGAATQLIGVNMDITERKVAEIELTESETQYRALFENAIDSVLITDNTGSYIDANPAACRLLGRSSDEIIGRTVNDFAAGNSNATAEGMWNEFLEDGEMKGDFQLLNAGGKIIDVEYSAKANFLPGRHLSILRDRTSRNTAEAELRKSREHMALAQKVSKVGSWETDLSTMQVVWSDETFRIFEVSSATAPTHDEFLDMVHFDDRAAVDAAFKRSLEDPAVCSLRHRIVMSDGRIKFVEEQWEIFSDDDGKPLKAIGTCQDMTSRTLAQASQRETEERLRMLFDQMTDGFYCTTSGGKILDVNPAMVKMFGYASREEMLKVDVTRDLYFAPEDRERRAPGTSNDVTDVYEMKRKDGTRIWVEDSGQYKYDESGKVVIHQGILRDVTERKIAANELSRSEARFRDLVENAHDIIFTLSLDGKYTTMNEAGEHITGYTSEEAQQMTIDDTIAPEDRAKVREMIARKLAGESSTAYEIELVAKDGHRVPLEVNSRVIWDDDKPVGIHGIARDVSGRKQLEDQLRQAQKLESVGLLAGGIAHDFNNMLTAINGYSELTLRKMNADDPLRRNIEEIKKAGEHSAELTNQLLAFSRQQILRPELVSINAAIQDTSGMLQRLLGENIQMITTLSSKAGSVKVDPGQLSQIIMNLAVNARDAMPNGGKLNFETQNVVFNAGDVSVNSDILPGAYVMLAITDTGIGMTAETKSHMFEPFFTTKEIGKGTGLGLATVYGIVKQSGGHIYVYSEVGNGTTFNIYLPRVMESDSEFIQPEHSEDSLPKGTETILLVEDESAVRAMTKQALEICGYTVLEAGNGHEAIELCENVDCEIKLLMTDVVMPGMGGRELAERFMITYPEMIVLFTSGYTDDATVRQGVIDLSRNFIQKPFTINALAQKVRSVLDAAVGQTVAI